MIDRADIAREALEDIRDECLRAPMFRDELDDIYNTTLRALRRLDRIEMEKTA